MFQALRERRYDSDIGAKRLATKNANHANVEGECMIFVAGAAAGRRNSG